VGRGLTKVMVMGDPHAHPRYDNDRFEVLGAHARQIGADHVHCVGDWTDFPSLNEHRSARDQRPDMFHEDVEAGNDALLRFDEGLDGHPCEKSITLGNHDAYPDKWVGSNPKFEGVVSSEAVLFPDHGWGTTAYLEARKVRGLWCSHFMPSGATGRPQGGIHVAYHNAMKQGMNCLVGHNHRFDHKVRTLGDGAKIHSFSAGCLNHPRYAEQWCANTRHTWDRGVLVVDTRRGRVCSFSWTCYDDIRRGL